MDLRFYQKAAVEATFSFFKARKHGHPLIVLPTGSGKSLVIASIAERARRKWPNLNILVISHNQEILEQNYWKLRKWIDPGLIGIYSAGLGAKNIRPITVASIQSIWRKPEQFQQFKLLIIDECHTIPPGKEGMYKKFFTGLKTHKILGLTATPFRTGFGKLTDKGHLFSEIIYEISIDILINKGYLSLLKSKAAHFQMDPTNVKTVAGEYVAKQLAEKFDQTIITTKICKELATWKNKRKHWLVFAIDIAHAEHIADKLAEYGIAAMYLHSKMPAHQRSMTIDLFKNGTIQALVNVTVLTTGFDYPEIDMIALLRPTRSPVLHVQMIGRGSRIAPGKKDCIVLDFAGNLHRLGPVNADFEFKKSTMQKGAVKAPVKTCPDCDEVLHIKAKTCPECGYVFKFKTNLTLKASDASVIKTEITYDVDKVFYHRHKKEGKPDSLKVTYVCGRLKSFREWIPLESLAMRAKSEFWWKKHAGTKPPKNVNEALERTDELIRPARITVDESGKWPRIVSREFVQGDRRQTTS